MHFYLLSHTPSRVINVIVRRLFFFCLFFMLITTLEHDTGSGEMIWNISEENLRLEVTIWIFMAHNLMTSISNLGVNL